jgi:two-component system, LuxR family, sensor histidine kinase TtrS
MTRQISEISNEKGQYRYKTTSLKPLNPSNKADSFEETALHYFENNQNKKYYYQFNQDENNFNFMGALSVKKACMQCHQHQGYNVGDIRGGISITIPTQLYNEQMALLDEKTKNDIQLTLIIALLIISILMWIIHMFYKHQFEIEHLNEVLEDKVAQRTTTLEQLLTHEQQLKDVLKLTSEVNEMLISSYSIHSMLKNSSKKLAQNDAYSLVIAGLVKNDILEIVCESTHNSKILPDTIISLNDLSSQNFIIKTIKNALNIKHSIIEKISSQTYKNEFNRRSEDTNLSWLMVLPLMQDNQHEAYGIIAVFCSREEGFEPEEIRILENMAHDINIALYSHKQRSALLNMEKEKVANYEETILAFVNIIEQRDTYTAGHTIRVAEYCSLIATEMNFNPKEIHQLTKAAILHDIGKVATPDAILLKPGKLSLLEYELIKQHSEVGTEMLEHIEMYKDLAQIIKYHHSRYDGKGYPRTASPDEIPMLSHIMIVADAFDAMTTNRIYKPRKSIDDALTEIQRNSKIQFHPDVVAASMKVLKNIDISNTTQMPTSELEERRMSYFFQDSLTGLYNEDYLQVILNSSEQKYRCLNIIYVHNFSAYNQEFGWDKGNTLLQKISELLKTYYPNSTIIRYHGDDFVVLNKIHNEINMQKISSEILITSSKIELDIRHYEIDEFFTFEKFVKQENS